MSRGWKPSGLRKGDGVRVDGLMVLGGPEGQKRFLGCTYEGETETGIIVRVRFMPLLGSEADDTGYLRHICWNDVWCGAMKLYGKDGQIKAKHKKEGEEWQAFTNLRGN